MTNANAVAEPIAICDETGQVVLRVGLVLTLYFDNGFDLEIRRRIGECTDYFRSLGDGNVRWVVLPGAQGWNRVDRGTIESYHEWLRTGSADYSWYTSWRSGQNPHEASEYQFNILAKQGRSPTFSYLQVVLPMERLQMPWEAFPEVCLRFCTILLPHQGYGGYVFVESSDIGNADEIQPTVYAMASRFPGIEVDRPIKHIRYVDEGIKGVNWLTVLGPQWASKAGSASDLRSSLGAGYFVEEYDGSLLIQAGPQPEMGDVHQRLWPRFYPKLARLLKPIRITKHGSFDNAGENRFTKETSKEWLQRFDTDPTF
jgi:hypothetical protein